MYISQIPVKFSYNADEDNIDFMERMLGITPSGGNSNNTPASESKEEKVDTQDNCEKSYSHDCAVGQDISFNDATADGTL